MSNLHLKSCDLLSKAEVKTIQRKSTVEPPFKGHPRDKEKCPLNRGWVGVKDVKYEHFSGTKIQCPLNGGVPE